MRDGRWCGDCRPNPAAVAILAGQSRAEQAFSFPRPSCRQVPGRQPSAGAAAGTICRPPYKP
ncbi:hypothetical protein KI387_040851, partial [Taxus chinensis]